MWLTLIGRNDVTRIGTSILHWVNFGFIWKFLERQSWSPPTLFLPTSGLTQFWHLHCFCSLYVSSHPTDECCMRTHPLGVFTARAGLPGKPTKSFWLGSAHAPLGPPPHGPLFGWHLYNGHLKKVHSFNSHRKLLVGFPRRLALAMNTPIGCWN